MQPGFHQMTAKEYHADPCPVPSLSSSIANIILSQSSLHAWYAHPKLNPKYEPANNAILDAGSVAHAILLEGSMERIVVIRANDFRTNLAKEERDRAWSLGLIPVLEGKLDKINQMVEAAKKYLDQSELCGVLHRGKPEQTMIWQKGNIWCRARLDWITNDQLLILDYKTTAGSAEPSAWIRNQMMPMGYDVQAGFYLNGADVLVNNMTRFVFLVQENESPFACSLIGMSPAMLDLAQRKIEFAITLFGNALHTKRWLGYPNKICYAEPPAYATVQFEEKAAGEDE